MQYVYRLEQARAMDAALLDLPEVEKELGQ
jgi:hypothetical protein